MVRLVRWGEFCGGERAIVEKWSEKVALDVQVQANSPKDIFVSLANTQWTSLERMFENVLDLTMAIEKLCTYQFL